MTFMDSAVDKIKVWFRFTPREGWLPQDTEGLWAIRVGEDTALVQNVPFLQDGVAEGDVVRFVTNSDGLHWAVGRVSSSADFAGIKTLLTRGVEEGWWFFEVGCGTAEWWNA
ncbi:DUF4265 domain-containing protein [Nocardia sp. NPDC004340]